jgi:cytoskeletal protein CcmA (bactofilin family)
MGLKQLSISKLVAVGILVVAPLFGWMGIAQAHSFRNGDNTVVAAGETVDSTLFITGRTIDIAGNVNGDVFCAGQNVTITGYVSGDVICAGQSVRVSGKVDGDVRVAGQNVAIGGTIGHNLSAAGQTIASEANSRVEGDASLGGQDITLNGLVGRDLAATSGNVTINGRVGRNVQADVTQLALGDHASVGGNVQYASQNNINRASGSEVTGKLTRSQPSAEHKDTGGSIWYGLWFFVSMLLLALALVLLMPRTFRRATDLAMSHPGKTLLVGLLSSIVVPILVVVLLLTVVAIPLALLLLLAWLIALAVAGSFAAFLLGRYLLRGRTDNAIWIMLLGGAVLLLVNMVPFIDWVVSLLALWMGLGMIVMQLMQLRKTQHVMPVDKDKLADSAKKDKADKTEPAAT